MRSRLRSFLLIGRTAVLGLMLAYCGTLLGESDEFAIKGFSAEPAIVAPGETTSLTWSVSGADIVELDNGIGPVRHDGTLQIAPKLSTTYKLTAIGGTSTGTSSVRVEVEGAVAEPTPTPTPTPTPEPSPTPEPGVDPLPTPNPAGVCWALRDGVSRDCAPCRPADQVRTGWPIESIIETKCQVLDEWMPCSCSDGSLWPGIEYTRDTSGADERWYWEKDKGACAPVSGKCFCDPLERPQSDRRSSLTCQVVWPQLQFIEPFICEWDEVPCPQ